MRRVAILLGLLCIVSQVLAQKKPDQPPPVLASDNGKPLTITKAEVRVIIAGYLAQTTITLTFQNDLDRVLEGQLSFPLPQGAVLSGYGLDVNGEMVDGVPVEKHKARIVYEREVRKGIDPGLVEHVVGNNFRTRIYPIPARGTRMIKVQYVSDLADQGTDLDGTPVYRLGLDLGQPIANYALHIEMVDPAGQPKVQSGPAGLSLAQVAGRTIADKTYHNVSFKDELVISLPQAPGQQAIVEQRTSQAGASEYYFVIHDTPQPVRIRREPYAMGRIGIAWDASLSRSRTNHQREIELIRQVATTLGAKGIDLLIFRDRPEAVVELGSVEEAIKRIEAAAYDGGTNLADVKLGKACTFWMLFTDGLGDLYADRPRSIESRVFTFSNEAQANPGLLDDIARKSGGAYFDARACRASDVIEAIEFPRFSLLSLNYDPGQIADVYPAGPRPVSGRMAVSGRLLAPQARITLNYGIGSQVLGQVNYTLRQSDATQTGLAPRFWAQQKIAALSALPDENRAELEKVGREFSLVTPDTSLMVLETLEQYLQYRITPPKTRGDIYAAYMKRTREIQAQQEATRKDKLEKLVQEWNQRVQWWEAERSYPKNFRYIDLEGAVNRVIGGLPGLGGGQAAPATGGRSAAGPVVNAPRPAARANEDVNADRSQEDTDKKKDDAEQVDRSAPAITIKPWDPETPYLLAIRQSAKDPYATYLAQRDKFGGSPAFYLDCADYFLTHNQRELGIRILTDVAELDLDSAPLMRIAAHRLMQIGEIDLAIDLFEKVLASRPEEPQSYRDLALALIARGDSTDEFAARLAPYLRALDLLHQVVMGSWDRFEGIEIVALMEANALWDKINRLPQRKEIANPFDPRLVKNLDCDVRVVLTWDTDLTDMDLWVTEPSGEKCVYDHNRTVIGGLLSDDFTQGYGPEEYCLRKAMPGNYKIQADYFGSRQQSLSGPTTLQATVITDFGRPTEKRKAITLRLVQPKEVIDIGSATMGQDDPAK